MATSNQCTRHQPKALPESIMAGEQTNLAAVWCTRIQMWSQCMQHVEFCVPLQRLYRSHLVPSCATTRSSEDHAGSPEETINHPTHLVVSSPPFEQFGSDDGGVAKNEGACPSNVREDGHDMRGGYRGSSDGSRRHCGTVGLTVWRGRKFENFLQIWGVLVKLSQAAFEIQAEQASRLK